jgi:uncharacterized protein YecT (DUF1311 family)
LNGVEQDLGSARALAWQERAATHPYPGDSPILGAALVLAMIYANGDDVPRDPALALHLGCEANLTGADLDALDKVLASNANPAPRFDICSPGSPEESNEGLCGFVHTAHHRKGVLEEIGNLTADWTPEQKATINALHEAERTYSISSSSWEEPTLRMSEYPSRAEDLSGAEIVSRFDKNRGAFDEQYLAQLKELVSGQHVLGTVKGDDAELNRSYDELMDRLRAPGRQLPPHVVLDVLQERGVERDWIAYRDAWVAVIMARFGAAAAAAWRKRMTTERTRRINKLSAICGPPEPNAAMRLTTCGQGPRRIVPGRHSCGTG